MMYIRTPFMLSLDNNYACIDIKTTLELMFTNLNKINAIHMLRDHMGWSLLSV